MKNILQINLPEFLRYSIKYSFTILIVFVFTTNVFSQEDNFSGTYSYHMTLPGGNLEKGMVQVKKIKEIYEIIWNRSDGPQYYGLGITTGNLLSVAYSYGAPWGQGERGVAVYNYLPVEKKIIGRWAFMGGDHQIYFDSWSKE